MLPVLLAVLLLAQDGGTPPPPAPSKADIERVEAELDAALRGGDAKAAALALESARSVPHPDVVRRVARALADPRPEVAAAAVQALRWNEHPSALEALHRETKEKKRMRAREHGSDVLRAIGQHADPSSVPFLARDAFECEHGECLRARILGLGNVRTRESLEALIGIVGATYPDGRERRVKGHLDDVRLALMVLTATDHGRSPEQWERWWRTARDGFEVSAEPPQLPREVRETWDQFWGRPLRYEREGRREDRGREPAPPRKE